MTESKQTASHENTSRPLRKKQARTACRHYFPQWTIEIFNCCSEEEVSHCLRADFAHYFPEAKVLVLGLENSWENAGAQLEAGQMTCQIHHKWQGELLGLQQLRMNQQFVRALKWDVEELSLRSVQSCIPKLFARGSLYTLIMLVHDAITHKKDMRLDGVQCELICEDSSIRTARLTIEVAIHGDCLITTVVIDKLISEERRTAEPPSFPRERIKAIKNLLI